MKKLLTLILPAMALITGAPMAEECEYGYSTIAAANKLAGNDYIELVLGHGLDAAEAKSAALNACNNAPDASSCHISFGMVSEGKNGRRCMAVAKGLYPGGENIGLTYEWGANEADAKKRAMETRQDLLNTRITDVMCTECLANEGYRWGAFARDNARGRGKYGWATNFQSRKTAHEGALSECARIGGERCGVILSISTMPFNSPFGAAYEHAERDEDDPNGNQCLAYVDNGDGRPAYPELKVGSSQQEAIDKSMQYCGDQSCVLQLALCADDDPSEIQEADRP